MNDGKVHDAITCVPQSYRTKMLESRVLGGSQAAQPHLEDSTTYHPLRPTKLDKIKNLYSQFQGGALGGDVASHLITARSLNQSHTHTATLTEEQNRSQPPRRMER